MAFLSKLIVFGLALLALEHQVLASKSPRASGSAICEHFLSPLQAVRFGKQIMMLGQFAVAIRKAGTETAQLDLIIDEMVAKDARGFIFKIEALSRIYEDRYGEGIAAQKELSKEIEDLLGKYTEKLEYLDYAKKLRAPVSVLRKLEEAAVSEKNALRAYLPRFAPFLESLESVVRQTKWDGQARDSNTVLGKIAEELKKYEKLDYEVNDLQGGIHEMRRNFRWILMYLQVADGLILAEKGAGKLNEYSYLESHPIAQSRFSRLDPNPSIKNPAFIPFRYFLALSKIVQELGVIKSAAENIESLAWAYKASGLAHSLKEARAQARKLAQAKDPEFISDAPGAARQVVKELKRTKLLKKLRKSLDPPSRRDGDEG